MTLDDLMQGLRDFDMAQLNDFNNAGAWPSGLKNILYALTLAGCLVPGYSLHIKDLRSELKDVRIMEEQLRSDYEDMFFVAAHFESWQLQQHEMEESFRIILEQLPEDTEIPGLLEDINRVGVENGLSFQSIELQPEIKHEFYIEKPITIIVSGGYHNLGAFVSDVADLSRIVTLHDFSIMPVAGSEDGPGSMLTMSIEARTYRYNDEN